MFVNSVECLVRNGYQIHVISSGEIHVYFAFDSQVLQQEAWSRDAELIRAFIGERKITAYYTFAMNQVPAPLPPTCPIAAPAAPKPATVAKPAATEPALKPAPAPKPFKPVLKTLPSSPKKKKFVLNGATEEEEYSIYTKEDGTLHIHWLLRREEAKQVWRRDREKIQTWLGGRTLNTVSWRKYNNK